MNQLTQIDRLSLPDHAYLNAEDRCFFWGEYTARRGYAYSDTNSLILNFKKPPSKADLPEWKYKQKAIEKIAEILGAVLTSAWLQSATLVPMPPSKAKDDPLYDNRMLRVLHLLRPGQSLDIRELIRQRQSTPESHTSEERPTPQDLMDNYFIDNSVADPTPEKIALFDDVITTGAHFKAAQAVIQKRFPGVRIGGIFIARRVPRTDDIEDLQNWQ